MGNGPGVNSGSRRETQMLGYEGPTDNTKAMATVAKMTRHEGRRGYAVRSKMLRKDLRLWGKGGESKRRQTDIGAASRIIHNRNHLKRGARRDREHF